MTKTVQSDAFSELYSAYAAGCLDPAFALLVETQSALRSDVAGDVCRAEMIAGEMLERQSPSDMREGAISRALAAIDAFDAADGKARTAASAAGDAIDELLHLPEPLRAKAIDASGERGWQFTTPGIRRLPLDLGGQAEVELYRIEPNAAVPRHTHDGNEFTLVVAGGFTDETGSFGPGDLSVNGPDDTHQPIGDPGGACYALAVRDGGLRLTGVMGVIQRMLGA